MPPTAEGTTRSLQLPPIERRSLRGEAIDLLRARITAGELEPGRLYAIGDIAAQLGVSPTPVREAVLDLANQGLTEVVRNRGFRIIELSGEELEEIVVVRRMLEAPAMGILAGDTSGLDLPALRELSGEIERAAAAGDLVSFLTLDKEFHLSLLYAVGNARLVQVVAQLRDQTRLTGLPRIRGTERLIRSAHEHDLLLDALEAADAAGAETLMSEHLNHVTGLWAGHDEEE